MFKVGDVVTIIKSSDYDEEFWNLDVVITGIKNDFIEFTHEGYGDYYVKKNKVVLKNKDYRLLKQLFDN